MPNVSEVLVRGVALTKAFGGSPVLQDANIELRAGEVHALCGENGAGKSTLAKLLAGIHLPTAGHVEIGSQSVRFSSPREATAHGIALIPQEPQTFPDLSVAENLFLGRPPRKYGLIDTRAMNAEAARWLETVGAKLDPRVSVRGLSVADRQLIELASALSQNAKVLFLDETTASLTPSEVARLGELIARLKAEGCAIGFVSHRMEEIFSLCDHITVLRDGLVVGDTPVNQTTPDALVRLMVGRNPELVAEATHALSQPPPPPIMGGPAGKEPPITGGQGGMSEGHESNVATGKPDSESPSPLGEGLGRGIPGTPLLEARKLSRRKKFEDISLSVHAGEIVGLAGLVGAGRTEVARALFGLLPLDSGEVLLSGKPVKINTPKDAMALGLALVPEDRQKQGALLPWTLWQNASLASLPAGWLKPEAERASTASWIERLDVRCRTSEQLLSELSGGNQQKIVLAKWLKTNPKILILDEPTRGVDVGAKARIHEEIKALKEKGVAVLVISSDLPEILALSDRLYVLRAGKLAATFTREDATPESVIAAASGALAV